MKKQNDSVKNIQSLEEALFAFRRKLKDVMRQEFENLQCPISQVDSMTYIAEKGTPSMKEIASYLKITPPSVTAIIETMQKKGLINRVSNKKDRRTIRVTLTPKAWKLLKSLHDHKFTIMTKMFSKLHQNEQEQFIRILNILTKE